MSLSVYLFVEVEGSMSRVEGPCRRLSVMSFLLNDMFIFLFFVLLFVVDSISPAKSSSSPKILDHLVTKK